MTTIVAFSFFLKNRPDDAVKIANRHNAPVVCKCCLYERCNLKSFLIPLGRYTKLNIEMPPKKKTIHVGTIVEKVGEVFASWICHNIFFMNEKSSHHQTLPLYNLQMLCYNQTYE